MDTLEMLAPLFIHELYITVYLVEERSVSFPLVLGSGDGNLHAVVPGTTLTWTSHWTRQDNALRLEIGIQNTGQQPVQVETVCIGFEACDQQADADWRVFLDAGECAWCGVKRLSALDWDPAFDVIAEQRIKTPSDHSGSFHRSSLQTVLFDARGRHAWLLGFLRQRHGYNGLDLFPETGQKARVAKVEAWQVVSTLLHPDAELVMDPLVVISGADPLNLLEQYALLVQVHHGREFADSPIVGMMTWYGYRTAIDRDIILQNAELVGELFEGYPQSMRVLMLLDHGWQPDANWGYWDEADTKRFPEGMRWLRDELHKRGMELALWYTPFCITENCPILDDIRPLMALDSDDEPYVSYACVWGQLPGHSTGNWPITFFNGGRDDVQDKWATELHRMAYDWGCVYWKLDFFALITSAERSSSLPTGELYARTYASFRNSAGEQAHLAPCSCDTNIQLGYNDSIRVAADIGNAGTWPHDMSSYARGFTTIAALWYKHRRFWVNDADSVQIGCGCGLNEARVRATVVAFSGGHLMVSEDLRWMSPDRIELVRRLLPAYGVAARPLDLFEHVYPDNLPHIWQLPVRSDWGACNALAIFNFTDDAMRINVRPEWFGLQNDEDFGVLEWWQQRWLGRFDGPFDVIIPPADVAVLHAQKYRAHPWFVSVSHHFTGGWIVENLMFDDTSSQLRGELVTRPGLSMSIVGTLPPGWTIPSNADYHGRSNGAGGWAHEVRTTSQRTPFAIQFGREG